MRQSPLAAAAHVCCVLPPGHYVLCIKAGWSNHLLTPIIVMYLNSKSYLHFVYPDAVTLHIRATVILLKCVTLSHPISQSLEFWHPRWKFWHLNPIQLSTDHHQSMSLVMNQDSTYCVFSSSTMATFIKNGRLWFCTWHMCKIHFLYWRCLNTLNCSLSKHWVDREQI